MIHAIRVMTVTSLKGQYTINRRTIPMRALVRHRVYHCQPLQSVKRT